MQAGVVVGFIVGFIFLLKDQTKGAPNNGRSNIFAAKVEESNLNGREKRK